MSRVLKLGTRRSALAWAQSSWVAREIEKANAGVRVELVGIETRGDRILDVPLSQVQGKEFFVAEIDEALVSGAVDLTVHSMKDLSLDRPAGTRLAAAPRRENPRDVLLCAPNILERLASGEPVTIGTSAPRRLENLPAFLEKALPRIGPNGTTPRVRCLEIRGNVNTRLARVQEPMGSERRLDAVVLAFAGLIRLWNDDKGRAELTRLLAGVRWMVLPLAECPTAPAQGMLAVECRAGDDATYGIVHRIHHEASYRHVASERRLLAEWGGGCHQRFGATEVAHERLGELFFVRGRKPDGGYVGELRWARPARPTGSARAWDGSAARPELFETVALKAPGEAIDGAVFVAHPRALESVKLAPRARLWVSGTSSWFKAAARGLWVEGSAENLGFEAVEPTLAEPVLRLPEQAAGWTVLTHEGAAQGWGARRAVATYRLEPKSARTEGGKLLDEVRQATHVFWSSGSQFAALGGQAAPTAQHACGPGKTATALEAAGIRPTVFPSAEEWRSWIAK